MPRPSKEKRVCRMPKCQEFAAFSDGACEKRPDKERQAVGIAMTVEEYECIRLIDYSGLTQEECSRQMGASRATIQGLYASARKKLARFLVEASQLKICGGDFSVCSKGEGQISCLRKSACRKGEIYMKIAVTYENGQVFQHFGHTEQFKIYETEEGKVTASEVVSTDGFGHGALAGFLKDRGVNVLICGGIGGGARNALAEAGIELYPGACGDADAQVESFLAGSLNYDPDTQCNHHGEHHGEGECHGNHHGNGECHGHHKEGGCHL